MSASITYRASILGAIFIVPAFGIEPLPDESKAPAAIAGAVREAKRLPQAIPETPQTSREKTFESAKLTVPFIGISTAAVPEVLAAHLPEIKNEGSSGASGIVVRSVFPGGPAERSGLAVNDVIFKIGEEHVDSPAQFSQLIQNLGVGDLVKLSVVHQGQLTAAEVTLGSRPSGLAARDGTSGNMFESLPESHRERLRGLIEQNLQAFGADTPDFFSDRRPYEGIHDMRRRMGQAMRQEIPPPVQRSNGRVEFQQNSSVRVMDNQGSVEITSSNGSKNVTVRDQDNNTIWSGPWNTDSEIAAAGDSIRQRVEKVASAAPMERSQGFSFRFGGGGDQPRARPGVIEN